MKSMSQLLHEHPFFSGMDANQLDIVANCGANHIYNAGEYIARENAPADQFYVIRDGQVAVECFVPNHGALCLQTLNSGDIFGWSWLFPPYLWTFDAKAMDEVHAIRLDGKCLREKCEADPALGYQLMKRFAQIISDRVRATRVQLMDVYGQQRPPLEGDQ
ncbi:cyclic nucleotide-binding domain-containing protein [Microbulbifer sp. Q7]|uniref:cyclic nucleotide-binding domain-containing protein n=1 Tax=Microbulbifer sp. Q7 TaxID=1785091 RepID=UPI0008324D41|nr:cyclic nucleotide-binding domain-containing protein [Microbulbifer sp. Q7]